MNQENQLSLTDYFMNPHTGSVASWGDWVDDYLSAKGTEFEWPEEDLDDLIEVERDENGDWIAVN